MMFAKIKGVNELLKNSIDAVQKLSNPESAYKRSIIGLDRWIQKNFQTEGETSGEKWKPLKESTIKARRHGKKKKYGVKILQSNGDLRRDWKHFYSNKQGRITSGHDYGIYHDSDAPRHVLPQRKILPRYNQIQEIVNPIFDNYIKETINKGFK